MRDTMETTGSENSHAVTIRRATLSDLPVLLPQFRAYQEHYGTLTSASEAQTHEFLRGLLQDTRAGFVLVASADGQPAGFAAVYFTVSGLIAQRLAHLGDLYVGPPFRKRGIGTALFDAVARESSSCGINLVRWLSLASNTEVNAWYSKVVKPMGTFELYLRPAQG